MTRMRNATARGRLTGAIAVTVIMGTASPSLAQAIPNEEELQPLETSGLIVGLGAAAVPTYPGAQDYRVRPVPILAFRFGRWLEANPHTISAALVDVDGLRLGPLIGFNYGRSERRDPALTGLGNIPSSFEAGGFLKYTFGRITFSGDIRQAVTHTSNGYTAKLSLRYRYWLIPHTLEFSFGPRLDFADGAHSQAWFGISPDQSLASGLPAYTAHGGLSDAGAGLDVTYLATEHWLLRSYVEFRDLTGSVGNSPIVQSKAQTTAGMAIAYRL